MHLLIKIHKIRSLIIICTAILIIGFIKFVPFNNAFYKKTNLKKNTFDFNVTHNALIDAANIDIQYHNTNNKVSWIDIITCLACKYENDFSKYKTDDIKEFEKNKKSKKILEQYKKDINYSAYHSLYYSALNGILGNNASTGNGNYEKYGIKAFSPVASNCVFDYSSDDSIDKQSNINVPINTPIAASESGYIKSISINKNGSFKIVIQSTDEMRCYSYNNLILDNSKLGENDFISAGNIVGYAAQISKKSNKANFTFGIAINNADFKDKWINTHELTKFLSVNKTYATQCRKNVKLAVIMYHGFTNDNNTSQYVLSKEDFEQDMQYITKNGFETVSTNDLCNYIEYGIPLPNKPIMITFDDGYLNNYIFAYPIIKKYNAKVIISPIASMVEFYSGINDRNPLYAHITKNDISEMIKDGLVEFQNHSYNMHKKTSKRFGSFKNKDENTNEYLTMFYEDLTKADQIINTCTGKKPIAYTYPFGNISIESEAILKCCGYKISFGCSEGFNVLSNETENLYRLKRFNRTPQKSVCEILNNY